jgi:glutaredoxin
MSSRRGSSKFGSASFYIPLDVKMPTASHPHKINTKRELSHDIEKQDMDAKPSLRIAYIFLFIMCALFLVATGGTLAGAGGQRTSIERFHMDQNELLSKVLGGDVSATSASTNDNEYNEPKQTQNVAAKIINHWVKNLKDDNRPTVLIGQEVVKDESILANTKRPEPAEEVAGVAAVSTGADTAAAAAAAKAVVAAEAAAEAADAAAAVADVEEYTITVSNEITAEEDVYPQMDLKEILSVSPIVIIKNTDPHRASVAYLEKAKQVENILNNLNITPQPRTVSLIKHPHYNEIVEYLKTYQTHKVDATESTATEGDVTVEDIPSVFVGGLPIGNYDDIIELFRSKLLTPLLRKTGKGLITMA